MLYPIESVQPDEVPDLSLERVGRLPRFRLLHDAFKLKLSPPGDVLVGVGRSRIRFEPYQYVPAMRALELPRPRLLLADDVGLGKTIEAGLILKDLAARRRANRALVVCPAGIMTQWQQELKGKFGFKFKIFDRDTLHEVRQQLEIGANPWAVESRVIASMDFIKRREGAFRELSSVKWDVVVVDEAHHLSAGRSEDDITDRHRLGRWLAEATDALLLLTATPHDGYDESFLSLLGLLEPSLVPLNGNIRFERYRRHLVRRLKGHIKNEDGALKFLKRQVVPIPVPLNPEEVALHAAVLSRASELELLAQQTRRQVDAEAIRLVATILRKRAASSHHALAKTLEQRRNNLSERVEDLEVQRDHLRALRRGDTIPDDALARLEQDAHKSYLSVIRRLGTQVRRVKDEVAAVEEVEDLLRKCQEKPESKMTCLLQQLRDVHREHPGDKEIVFTEYSDTVEAVVQTLQVSKDYADKSCLLTGDLSPAQRDQALATFAGPDKLVLVATDAAGEGLNLHRRCHRVIHFELPWNPNRLEQRNGRIDRYGQTETPIVGFLYAKDTYEGEVLSRLVDKIERQIERLGSVGDVLGQIQTERIEQILTRSPDDLQAAISQAEQEIDEEIARVERAPLHSLLGEGGLDQEEVRHAEEAAQKGGAENIVLADFLYRAVTAAGGHAERQGDRMRVWTPSSWQSASVQTHYEGLIIQTPEALSEDNADHFLDEDHPLIAAAVRWVKARRFDPRDDHRVAYVLTPNLSKPDLITTFLVQLRDGEGAEIERLEAVRAMPDGQVSRKREEDLEALRVEGQGNVALEILSRLFGSWWEQTRDSALLEARRRASSWRQGIIATRGLTQQQMMRELEEWNQASRRAIMGDYAGPKAQLTLFRKPELPPSIKRRLRQHEERYDQRKGYLERRIQFEDPVVEPLGVLLRVPAEGRQP